MSSTDPGRADAADPDREGTEPGVIRGSGDAAVAAASERAEQTGGRNITPFSDLPIPEDTANLRHGPDLHPGLLALLPLVGVWEGEGEGDNSDHGQHRFGQQIVVSHDGENYLSWTSRAWVLPDAESEGSDSDGDAGADEAGEKADGAAGEPIPAYRETGFWRITADDQIEFLVAHASGVIEMYYGKPVHQAAWELTTDVVLSSPTGLQTGGAKRLFGIVDGGDLGWVEERAHPEHGLKPHLSARLKRLAG